MTAAAVISGTAHRDESAADKIATLFGRFIGTGYLFYAVVSIPLIRDVATVTEAWWTPVALVAFFGPGLALLVASFSTAQRYVLPMAAACAFSYLLGLATWPFGWTGAELPDAKSTWFAAFPALSTLGAAVSMRPRWVFAQLIVVTLAVQTINFHVRESPDRSPFLADVAFAFSFSLTFVAASVMASRTGRILDETRLATYARAAGAAAMLARTVERRRFDGLIHDNVMSTLLSASRGPMSRELVAQAVGTLAELDALRDSDSGVTVFDVDQAVAHLRAAAGAVDPSARLEVVGEVANARVLSAEPIRTMGAALSEALRNSVRHAGPHSSRAVTVTVSSTELTSIVADDGSGFDPDHIPANRLGVRVSILDRMRRLPGGSATVRSAAGSGTVVELRWTFDG
ncbi:MULTISPECIES: ATP-binding protein [Nocardiaceae]|uniref:Signal transduction histidine kinase n=1 Tax=Rhodococcoides corynebacterioides TaxID=53972 RepID=A0ABS2KVB4_9NOCA|nr:MULTISPECIES: ATP-binding protein [Rhodococcus]MBM7415889.1 signal transduction histidine kinase [Rhodococcus corynebacterioides]MBP1118351.1 signal transduction histidine kinase [Rhodococcus sp. PvP016]